METVNFLPLTKNYLNIDFDDDDELIKTMIEGAMEYMKNAGVPSSAVDTFLYKLAIFSFVHFFYFDRERTFQKRFSDFSLAKNDQTFRNILSQLVE